MTYDRFCQNCRLDFQHLTPEEEVRFARDPGYCPNCAFPLTGNYAPPPPPPVWTSPGTIQPSPRSARRKNVFITSISFLLVCVGLFVLLSSCGIIDPGRLLGAKPSSTATSTSSTAGGGQGSGTTLNGTNGTQAVAITQTAAAGGGGSGGGSQGGGSTSSTATPGSGGGTGGGATPTATSVTGGGGVNPTATPTPVSSVVVTISSTSVTVQCGKSTTIVMTNPSSSQSASWSAHAVSVPAYTLTPSSGTIAPRKSASMVVSNITSLLPLGTIIVTSGGMSQTVIITCTLT